MIYAGSRGWDFYLAEKGSWRLHARASSLENRPFPRGAACGLILNPGPIVYNLFSFERLPRRRRERKELVEWRLQKVFPDSLAAYNHHFLVIGRNTVLSLLVNRDYLAGLERDLREAGLDPVFIGNSTVETMNRLVFPDREPTLVLEIDGELNLAWVSAAGIPLYLRKFSVSSAGEWSREVLRTVSYAAKSLDCRIEKFLLLRNDGADPESQAGELAEAGLIPLNLKLEAPACLPTGKTSS